MLNIFKTIKKFFTKSKDKSSVEKYNNKHNFNALTPIDDAELKIYKDALDFVFSNPSIMNVAISGSYGAGKSSILASYEKQHKKKANTRFLHISLAHFRKPEEDKDTTSDENDMVVDKLDTPSKMLEWKILNQLIHQIPVNKITRTEFKVKRNPSKLLRGLFTALGIANVMLAIYVFFFVNWISFVNSFSNQKVKDFLDFTTKSECRGVGLILFMLISAVFIYKLIKLQDDRKLVKRGEVSGVQFEISDCENSYFDKYLSEVLYLFNNSNADVIVFEDIDRYNSTEIFERLHEINTLVNNKRKNKPIRFFYLLKDDMFESKDRTKFFDYIVPVIPVIDGSNSYEQFIKFLTNGGIFDKFDQTFLQSLSLYIDDMRVLKNIYNEFKIYIGILNDTDLDYNKMLAMIAYKNLFPRDFSDLQLAKGFVHTLFAERPRLIDEALVVAREKKQYQIERIEYYNKEIFNSEQELDDAYDAKNKRLPRRGYYNELTNESEKIQQKYDEELSKRKQAVKDKLEGNLPKIEAELARIEYEITVISTKPLKDLITRENINSIFSVTYTNEIEITDGFESVRGNDYFPLLKFLIRNGHIDEITYNDYMTYFYDDSISAKDKTFLRRITDKRGADYTYKLKEPEKVAKSSVLRVVDFEQEETLNFDLFQFLLTHCDEDKYVQYLKTLVGQIRNKEIYSFLSEFYAERDSMHECFVYKINELWNDFFVTVLKSQLLSTEQIKQFSIETLCYCSDKLIEEVNVDNCLTEYISTSTDYLLIEKPSVEKLISGFILLEVSFIKINHETANKDLFDQVYSENLYSLTFENINLMLRQKYEVQSEEDITHRNYTLVVNQSDSSLCGYVSENISDYLKEVLSNCEDKISDDESAVINLLNNSDLDLNLKSEYIQVLTTKISILKSISDISLWKELLDREIIKFTETNFIKYFVEIGLDSMLVEFINSETRTVDFSKTADEYESETADHLWDAVLICNSLRTDVYKKILMDLGYIFDNFNATEIDDDKIDVLINEEILQMDEKGLTLVRDNYKSHVISYIRKNLNKYLEIQNEELFSLNEALDVITWNITDEEKIALLSLTTEAISTEGKRYTDAVNEHILNNNFTQADIPSLYMSYSCYGLKAKAVIADLAVSRVREIIVNEYGVNDELLSVLLRSTDIDDDYKIQLFENLIPNLNEETCKNHFDELGISELKSIFVPRSGNRTYENNAMTCGILEALKKNTWIYDYHETNNPERLKVVKNKPKDK